jgi:hypothetical protein
MSDKIQIQTQVDIASGTSDINRLQKQLDTLAKKLKLTIKDVELAGAKSTSSTTKGSESKAKAIKKEMDSVDKLILRYKAAQITQEQFQEYGRRLAESDKFREKSLQKQAKLYDSLKSASKQYSKSLEYESNVVKKLNEASKPKLKVTTQPSTTSPSKQTAPRIRQYESGFNNLLNMYKTKQITDDKFLQTAEKMIQKTQFQSLAAEKQAKIYKELTTAEANYV